MYIVTFEERYHASADGYIKSSRIYDTLDEVKEFVEYLYEPEVNGNFINIRVWRSDEIKYDVVTKITFDEE